MFTIGSYHRRAAMPFNDLPSAECCLGRYLGDESVIQPVAGDRAVSVASKQRAGGYVLTAPHSVDRDMFSHLVHTYSQ